MTWTLCGTAPIVNQPVEKLVYLQCSSRLIGRYLKIERNKTEAALLSKTFITENYLVLCEIVVWGHLEIYKQTGILAVTYYEIFLC